MSVPEVGTGRPSLRAITVLAWIAAFAVLLAVTALIAGPPPGAGDAPPLTRTGRQLVPNNPNARPQGDAILVANRREAPLTILAISQQPLRTADYGRLAIDAEPLPPGVEVALLWIRLDQPGKPHDQRIPTDSRGVLEPALLDRDAAWSGDVTLLALGVKGPMERPWMLRSVSLQPITTGSVIGDIVRGWRAFERWDGRSINVLFGGRDEQRAWFPPLAFAASAIAALAVVVVARRRRVRVGPAPIIVAFLIGWLALDVRWQLNLVEQARSTVAEFGGKTWEQKHASMEDADLFRFVQAARARLPADPVRIFVNSDLEYFRRRAGFHLYPHNVLAYSWAEPSQLRPGEYLLLYQKADVRFDTAQEELLWANGRRLDAKPLLVQRGAGLFVVGPKGGR